MSIELVGKTIRQVRVADNEYAKFLGRIATVVEAMKDEKGNVHVHTDDGVWCPISLIEVIETGASLADLGLGCPDRSET